MGPVHGAIELEGEFHTDTCQHQCPHGQQAPSGMTDASVFVPRVSCSCLLPPRGSPGLAGMSDSGSFQIIASSLGPRACEILYVSFKSGVSISHSHLFGSPKVSPTGLSKPNVLRAYIPGRSPGMWYLMYGSDPCSLRQPLQL